VLERIGKYFQDKLQIENRLAGIGLHAKGEERKDVRP